MKLLFLTDTPFFPVQGGADRVVCEQATRLSARGHEIAVICRDKLSVGNRVEKVGGLTVHLIGTGERPTVPALWKSFGILKQALKPIFYSNASWEGVLFHQPLIALAARQVCKTLGIPHLYSFHSPIAEEYRLRHPGSSLKLTFEKAVLSWIEWRALKSCHLVLFDSHSMEKIAQEKHPGITAMPREVLPLAVDTAKFALKRDVAAVRQRLRLWPERPLALTVRGLEPRMGLEALLEAWKMVKAALPKAVLLIGGEGSLRRTLEDKIKKWELEGNVKLLGFIPEEELPLYYQAADFFVLPTRELEGFGLVILEALACGTPVLGTHVGAIPEVLSPFDSNLILPSRRVHLMAQRLIEFIRGEEWRRFEPERCRRYVEERFSWNRHCDRLESLFKETGRLLRVRK